MEQYMYTIYLVGVCKELPIHRTLSTMKYCWRLCL